jgi:hypothetical protein
MDLRVAGVPLLAVCSPPLDCSPPGVNLSAPISNRGCIIGILPKYGKGGTYDGSYGVY